MDKSKERAVYLISVMIGINPNLIELMTKRQKAIFSECINNGEFDYFYDKGHALNLIKELADEAFGEDIEGLN